MMMFNCILVLCILQAVLAVKVKVVMHSDEDSRIEEEERPHTESWKKKRGEPLLPFIKRQKHEEKPEYEDEKPTTEKPHPMHPNDLIFPLIYSQKHVNSMFKYGENWYTWSIEKRTDGSKAISYYICYEEPKHCDEIGWDRVDNPPNCAFEIDSVMTDDRACINSFGVEPHPGGLCDGGEQKKVSDLVNSCGPRIRTLWRFVRSGRRPSNAAKPADVNSLVCEDEEECYITIEYRIHHDRITFSLHEPSRGQTFKSVLKRDTEEKVTTESRHRVHRRKKVIHEEYTPAPSKKVRLRSRSKSVEGKGVAKEHNDSGYASRRLVNNKIKIREDISDDTSE